MAIPVPSRVLKAVVVLLAVGASCPVAHAQSQDRVSLSERTISWSTVKFATDADNGFVDGSLDKQSFIDRSFKAYVLENRFLSVTLVPEFGGRILSMIYKPTGHEELYRTRVGVPYGMKGGTFYYDWLMVYGGIFPTFPDPEHGRTWLKPWDFHVVKQTEGEVTVSMSTRDDVAYAAAPRQFVKGATGIEATFEVTLKAGRAALDARVVLKNTRAEPLKYEYWTCTTLAPGSELDHPQTTGGAEIIAPVSAYTTPRWSANIAAADADAGEGRHRFEKLRFFKNWPTAGIAYAAPDMGGSNFWGVINHDNEEGIIRIADNKATPGLKLWTWGFPSFTNVTDERQTPDPARPYVELWAGASDQFFHAAEFPPLGEITIPETYAPTVGMRNVTDANQNILVNLSAGKSRADLQFVSLAPDVPLHVTLKRGEALLFDETVKADPKNGKHVSADMPDSLIGERVKLTITTTDGRELISAETKIR